MTGDLCCESDDCFALSSFLSLSLSFAVIVAAADAALVAGDLAVLP